MYFCKTCLVIHIQKRTFFVKNVFFIYVVFKPWEYPTYIVFYKQMS